jgi:methionine synthase II (cobalamin-independent)
MPRGRKPTKRVVKGGGEFNEKLRSLIREHLGNVDENELSEIISDMKKDTTKEFKTVKSSFVNQKYQEYVDNLNDTLEKLRNVFEKSEEIVAIVGRDRQPTIVKLVGYNSATGDIFYQDNDEVKIVKSKSVVTDISKIPVPRGGNITISKKRGRGRGRK